MKKIILELNVLWGGNSVNNQRFLFENHKGTAQEYSPAERKYNCQKFPKLMYRSLKMLLRNESRGLAVKKKETCLVCTCNSSVSNLSNRDLLHQPL